VPYHATNLAVSCKLLGRRQRKPECRKYCDKTVNIKFETAGQTEMSVAGNFGNWQAAVGEVPKRSCLETYFIFVVGNLAHRLICQPPQPEVFIKPSAQPLSTWCVYINCVWFWPSVSLPLLCLQERLEKENEGAKTDGAGTSSGAASQSASAREEPDVNQDHLRQAILNGTNFYHAHLPRRIMIF